MCPVPLCFGSGTHHHADVVLLSPRCHLHTLIDDEVHEGIEAPQDPLDVSAAI